MAAASGLAAAGSGFLFAASSSAQDAADGGEIIIGLNLEPDNLDPAVTPFAVSHWVMMNIYDTLVWRGVDGDFYPGLAESWEVSEDGTVYTFKLKDGVTFHDGTPFNADAVKFTFDHIVDPETHSGFASSLLGPYDRTEVLDDLTAEVHFTGPYAPLLDSVSQAFLGIVSPTAVQADPVAFLRNPVGTGFMKFSEWAQKDHITLTRNEDYAWASPLFEHSGPAHLEKVTFRFYEDSPTRLAALEAGDVNLIQTPLYNEVPRLEDSDDFDVNLVMNPGLPVVLFLNTTLAPTDDVAVRKAINLALDKELITTTGMFGVTEPAYGPLWKSTPYYSPAVETVYPFDPEVAKQTLEDAGWTVGGDGIREKDGQKLSFTLTATDFTSPFDELSQSLWKDVGIGVDLQQMDVAASYEAITNGTVNSAPQAWVSSDPVVLTNLFHSRNIDGGFAWSKFSDPHLDELLEQGEKAVNDDDRRAIYAEIQQIIVDNALLVPYYGNPEASTAFESKYQDIKQDFRNYLWLYDVSLAS